jgi:lipopolysaccharide export system protein LptA
LSLAVALSPTASGQSLDHDSSLPIEVTADSLEVQQEQRVAIFAGNVDAVQGKLVLSADKLEVHYEGKSGTVGVAADGGSNIRRIDASGHVILASPEETAEGSTGTYDVPAKLITLEGAVVLTRGENVIRGERLLLDLVSGKSKMVGTTATVRSDETEPASGRVRALFTPTEKGKVEDSDAGAATPPRPLARPE